jgi:hypothetical protein
MPDSEMTTREMMWKYVFFVALTILLGGVVFVLPDLLG